MRFTLSMLIALLGVAAYAQEAVRWKPADAYAEALADVKKIPEADRCNYRYVSYGHVPAAQRKSHRDALSFVVNSVSRFPTVLPLAQAGPSTVRVDLKSTKISAKAWDRLGDLGSGRTPQPEPYFHRVGESREEKGEVIHHKEDLYWRGGTYTRPDGKVYENLKPGVYNVEWDERRVLSSKSSEVNAHGAWLPFGAVKELVLMTESPYPVYRSDWFLDNVTQEPRYHEFLGLGDKEADFAKLFGADEKLADDKGAQVRGAVIHSEVANDRILERTPTLINYGRGYYWKSHDFEDTVKANVLATVESVLQDGEAHELIAALPNGLQAYFVSDDKGKRLDRAGIQFAKDTVNGFRSPEVGTRNCMVCHAKGMRAVTDEVRATARDELAAAASLLKKKDERLAEKFVEKYAAAPLNELLDQDAKMFENAVKAANGMTPAANAANLLKILLAQEGQLTLADAAADLGTTEADLKQFIPRVVNPDSTLTMLWKGRKVNREVWEQKGYHQLAEALEARKK